MKKIWFKIKITFIALMSIFSGRKEFAKVMSYGNQAVETVEVIKKIVDNPGLDLITELTPTEIDDRLLKALRLTLSELYDFLQTQFPRVPKSVTVEPSTDAPTAPSNDFITETQNVVVNKLRSLSEEQRTVFYHYAGKRIFYHLAKREPGLSEKLDDTFCATVVQNAYMSKKIGFTENV